MNHSNEVVLEHPNGTQIVLLGTQHVNSTHGSRVSQSIQRLGAQAVVLEVDQARFQQLDFRLAHLLHHDTHALMELTAADDSSSSDRPILTRLLPAALLWAQHQQQFQLMRNEGVPLLLGSLYGADFLQAALAAATAVPGGADVVLADQPQQLTIARFRALADTLSQLKLLLGEWWMPGGFSTHEQVDSAFYTQAAGHQQHQQLGAAAADWQQQQQQQQQSAATVDWQQWRQVLAAAAQLAAGRLIHHLLQWLSMAVTSQARWYGDNIHPVFLLVGDTELQDRLIARGCQGVREAAAAAGRLLELAQQGPLALAPAAAAAGGCGSRNGSNGGSNGSSAAFVQDIAAIRTFVASLEGILWKPASLAQNGATASGSGSSSSNGSSSISSVVDGGSCWSSSSSMFGGELLFARPWWLQLSEAFSRQLAALSAGTSPQQPAAAAAAAAAGSVYGVNAAYNAASASAAAAAAAAVGGGGVGGGGLTAALQHHSHSNVAAAAAYQQAVMAERNQVLTAALWRQAGRAAEQAAAAGAGAGAGSGYWSQGWKQQSQFDGGRSGSHHGHKQHYSHHQHYNQHYNQHHNQHYNQHHQQQQQQQQKPSVVAVVGYNHLPGIEHLWKQRQQQAEAANAAATGLAATTATSSNTTSSSGSDATADVAAVGSAFLPWQVVATDAVAGLLEVTAAGAAGLFYVAVVQRWTSRGAASTAHARAAAAAVAAVGPKAEFWGSSSRGMRRLGLLLLPAAVAMLPLQRDVARMQEASQLLTHTAAVNDIMLSQQAKQMQHQHGTAASGSQPACQPGSNGSSGGAAAGSDGAVGSNGLLALACQLQAAAASTGAAAASP